ncbi:MAG: MoaD/ThiS family protein [Actinomycetota bacterium]
MVKVEVVLKGSLAERLPGGRGTVELSDGSTVDALREALGLPTMHCIYVVNGTAVERGAPVSSGDRVQIFPPAAGGAGSSARRQEAGDARSDR